MLVDRALEADDQDPFAIAVVEPHIVERIGMRLAVLPRAVGVTLEQCLPGATALSAMNVGTPNRWRRVMIDAPPADSQRVFSTAAITAAAGWNDSDVTERCA